MREETHTLHFHTTKSRDEIIATLKNVLEITDPNPEREQAINLYYTNIAEVFTKGNGSMTVEECYGLLSFIGYVAFVPGLQQHIQKFSEQDRQEIVLHRIKYAAAYPDMITKEDKEWLASFKELLSTIVNLVSDSLAFTREFVAYTEIQIQDGED